MRVARRGCGDSCIPRPGLLIRAASTAAIVLTLGWFVWSIWVTATYGHVAPQDQARLFRYMFWRALLSAYLRLDRFCQLVYAYTVMGYAILSHFVLRPVANAFQTGATHIGSSSVKCAQLRPHIGSQRAASELASRSLNTAEFHK